MSFKAFSNNNADLAVTEMARVIGVSIDQANNIAWRLFMFAPNGWSSTRTARYLRDHPDYARTLLVHMRLGLNDIPEPPQKESDERV